MKKKLCTILVYFGILNFWTTVDARERFFELYMPDAETAKADSYMTTTVALPMDKTYYIVEFEPTDFVTLDTVHHLMIAKCLNPVKVGHEIVCEEQKIIYVWGRNAPKLILPKGMGFKVGRGTPVSRLKLTVHFAATPHPNDVKSDQIGVKLLMTDDPLNKTVGVFLLLTGGKISPGETEHFDVACRVGEDVEMHAFAFRPHTHSLGKSVSGYVVREVNNTDEWTLIGKEDPIKPQMFYPIKDTQEIVIKRNDILAARCSMKNKDDHVIYVGGTSHDEMCNFYIMYWVNHNKHPHMNSCYSEGPPGYHWETDPQLNNIPGKEDAGSK